MSSQIKLALLSLAFEDYIDDDDDKSSDDIKSSDDKKSSDNSFVSSSKKRKKRLKYKGLSKSEMLMKQDIDVLKVFAKKSNISFSNNISKKVLIDRIVQNRKIK